MNHNDQDLFRLLNETENQQIRKLNDIVTKSIEEEKLLTQKLRDEKRETLPFWARLADKVAQFGGSWTFICIFLFLIVIWIAINIWTLILRFDPYPFILLNLFLSLIAAIQAPIILMSQNRLEAKDRERSEHEYLINLKAELEVRALHQKIDRLILAQLQVLVDTQERQLEILQSLANGKKTS